MVQLWQTRSEGASTMIQAQRQLLNVVMLRLLFICSVYVEPQQTQTVEKMF